MTARSDWKGYLRLSLVTRRVELRKIALLMIVTLTCGSAALARDGGRGTSERGVKGASSGATHSAGPNRTSSATRIFIIRSPLPIRQAPASTGTVGRASSSRIDSRIDSRN